MATDKPADVPRRRRGAGGSRPSTRPAWEAAWKLLDDGGAHPRAEVIATMRDANPISYLTAREVLNEAVREGTLTVVERDRYGRPTLKRSDR
jgi:hypothetical protein